MHFSKAVRSAVIAAMLFAAPAVAAAPGDGRLYFATVVPPSVKVFLDGRLLGEVGNGRWQPFDVPAGAHTLRVENQGGSAAETQVNFDPAKLADAKNGRWWCAVSVPDRSNNVRLVMMSQPDCKEFVDAGS